jgi:Domain of unknown function (DUF4126)
MDLVPTVISTGYATGINAYGTVVLLNLLGRAGFGEVPEPLMGDTVLIGAGVMYAIEFVTDKIPYLDNLWDVAHTVIRPLVASLIGVEFAEFDQVSEAEQAISGGAAGGTALTSHAIKAGVRLGINASPEPFSNIFVSVIEDGIVAVVIALVLAEPLIALAVVLVLLAIGIGLILMLRKAIRRGMKNRGRPPDDRGPPSGPQPLEQRE